MRFSYGGYNHEEDEVGFTISYRTIYDKFQRRMAQMQTWNIVGIKQAASQSLLNSQLESLEAAYLLDYQDITLNDNSGAATLHGVQNTDTFSGIIVHDFGYPKGPWDMQTEFGAGGNCKRVFQIVLRAETRFGDTENGDLYAFRERVTKIGTGGSKRRYMPSLVGTPILQTLRAITPIRYVQEGYIISRFIELTVPNPLSIGNEMFDQRVITRSTPQDIRPDDKVDMWRTDYRYVFEDVIAQEPFDLNTILVGELDKT